MAVWKVPILSVRLSRTAASQKRVSSWLPSFADWLDWIELGKTSSGRGPEGPSACVTLNLTRRRNFGSTLEHSHAIVTLVDH